jgi:uncharacterized protein (TIGR02588 family)
MSDSSSERTAAERVTLLISLMILTAIFTLAVWANVRTGDAPPLIVVEAQLNDVRETDTGFYVPITITNTGGLTAQGVTVTGELDTGDGQPEMAEVVITFLAGGEAESAELIFSTHPNDGEFSLGATSYLLP